MDICKRSFNVLTILHLVVYDECSGVGPASLPADLPVCAA